MFFKSGGATNLFPWTGLRYFCTQTVPTDPMRRPARAAGQSRRPGRACRGSWRRRRDERTTSNSSWT
eukprot:scaffold175044_cov29-Prasinocladus_malaysianus.AAC.1